MSTSARRSHTGVQIDESASERSSLLSLADGSQERASSDEGADQVQSECWGPGHGYRVRKLRSKGALVVLLWNVVARLVVNVFPAAFIGSLPPFEKYSFAAASVNYFLFVVYSPLAGLLGDFYFGRLKFLHHHILLIWAGTMVCLAALLVENFLPELTKALNYGILLPACIVVLVGFVGVQVVSVPFGVDQMPDASTEEISAFIHWLIWAQALGMCVGGWGSLAFKCTSSHSASLIVLALVAAVAASVMLCTVYLFWTWFIVEPRCQNPIKSIMNVLKYALTHTHPARRSAFTYWEDNIPTRVDLGKSKYGGPFTNEQVEDVKTFFRVLLVIACIVAFVIPAEATIVAVSPYHYSYPNKNRTVLCFSVFVLHVVAVGVICIPLYELLVYPLARNWIPSSLKRVTFFAFMTIAVSIYLMMLDIVGQSQAHTMVPCMFQANETTPWLPISYTAVVVPVAILIGIQVLAFNIAIFEFICAQAPYHMKGFITGFGVMVINLAACLGDTLYFIWLHNWKKPSVSISCGTWYYLFTMVIGFVGLVLLLAVVRWYKERERDDIVNEHRFAEDYYTGI